jgi:hypothetical protein
MDSFRMRRERRGHLQRVLVGDLRAPSAAEQELDWFFGCAESAMGLRSNFLPLMEMALTGVKGTRSDPADTGMEDRLEAAHAARIIRARLLATSGEDAKTIACAYEPRQWPARVDSVFGRLAGVAVRTPEATSGFTEAVAMRRTAAESVAAWLDEAIACGGRRAVAPILWEAQCRWARAIRAYRIARGSGPSCVPKEP